MRIKRKEEEKLKEKTKKLSIKEGIAYSFMDGAGLKYITPYALAIGANNMQIGFLTSIPSLLGNFSQLCTSKLMKKFSRKQIITTGVFLQALMWLPILILGYLFFYKNFNHGFSATLFILFFTLLTIFGAFLGPAWNSLMRDIVDKKFGEYFGKRNKIIYIIVIFVMIAGGLILDYFEQANILFIGFLILFGIAFISRLMSVYFLSKHYEPDFKIREKSFFSFKDFLKRIPKSNFGKFTLFIALVMFATSIASPFFAVYMLKELNFSYATWMFVVTANVLSAFLFMSLWGKFADRFGNLKVLKWTGLAIPLIPFFWFLSPFVLNINYIVLIIYLILIECFSGFAWAGFNLSAANFIFDAVSKQKLSLCTAYYSLLNGLGIFLGATLGGLISLIDFSFFGISSILFIFLLSTVARFLAYKIMIKKIKEVRKVLKYKNGEFKKEVQQMFSPMHFIRNIPLIGPMLVRHV